MKKVKTFISAAMAAATVFSFASCSVKKADDTTLTTATTQQVQPVLTSATVQQPAESDTTNVPVPETPVNTKNYWESKYPESDIKSFKVKFLEHEEKDHTEEYFFIKNGSLKDWVNSDFNLGGWYFFNDKIIISDGAYCIDSPESLSKGVTYEAEPFDSSDIGIPANVGNICTVNSASRLNLKSVMLKGNLQYNERTEYSLHDLRYGFWFGEEISLYINGKVSGGSAKNVKIYILPHGLNSAFNTMTEEELNASSIAKFKDIKLYDSANYEVSCKTAVSQKKNPEGLYDLVFAVDGKIDYYMTLEIIEPT